MLFYKVSGYHFQLGIFFKVYLYKYNKNSFENIRTDIKIGDFLISVAYWRGFKISRQKRENPNEIGMVGQSE